MTLNGKSFEGVAEGQRGWPTQSQLRAIKLVIFDVDGVMTDGRIILNDRNEQSKFFDVRDGAGVTLLQNGGIMAALLTGRESEVVNARARELKLPPERVRQGAKVKLPVFERLLSELKLQAHECVFMGDDLIDLPVLERAGIAACPAESYADVQACSHIVSLKRGGRGAVRTVCEYLLKARFDGSWEKAVAQYLGRV